MTVTPSILFVAAALRLGFSVPGASPFAHVGESPLSKGETHWMFFTSGDPFRPVAVGSLSCHGGFKYPPSTSGLSNNRSGSFRKNPVPPSAHSSLNRAPQS